MTPTGRASAAFRRSAEALARRKRWRLRSKIQRESSDARMGENLLLHVINCQIARFGGITIHKPDILWYLPGF